MTIARLNYSRGDKGQSPVRHETNEVKGECSKLAVSPKNEGVNGSGKQKKESIAREDWSNHKDTKFDGWFVGPKKSFKIDPNMRSPSKAIAKHAFTPRELAPDDSGKGALFYTNGMNSPIDHHATLLQKVADATHTKVIGVHNATEGYFFDLVQCLGDKLDMGKNPAVDTLASAVYQQLKTKGEEPDFELRLMSHSQGALITSRALGHVKQRLQIEDGMAKEDAEKLMSKISCETLGGAATTYPTGPKYTHNINKHDFVAARIGLGSDEDSSCGAIFAADGGAGAKWNVFSEYKGMNIDANHDFDLYLRNRKPSDE